jgi:hypothetical protein
MSKWRFFLSGKLGQEDFMTFGAESSKIFLWPVVSG